MEPERYRPFNRRGRELELAARPLLVLSGCQRAGNHNNKTKTHLHRFLYTTPPVATWVNEKLLREGTTALFYPADLY